MSRITVLPSPAQPELTAIIALDGNRLGTFEKRGLWRNGVAVIGGVDVAVGIDGLLLFLEAVAGEPGFVMLRLHEGYHAVYADGAMPSSRILETGGGYAWRRFDPHASIIHAQFEAAVEQARLSHEH